MQNKLNIIFTDHAVYVLEKYVVPKVPVVYHGYCLWRFPPPIRDISKLRRWTMDGAAIYRNEAEIRLLLLENGPPISGVAFALNPIRSLASQVAHPNNNNNN